VPVFFMKNCLNMKDKILIGRPELLLKSCTRLEMIAVDHVGAFVAPGVPNIRAMARPHF
jgi:hypothetical protein